MHTHIRNNPKMAQARLQEQVAIESRNVCNEGTVY